MGILPAVELTIPSRFGSRLKRMNSLVSQLLSTIKTWMFYPFISFRLSSWQVELVKMIIVSGYGILKAI